MGTWRTPFDSLETAEEFKKKMESPWMIKGVYEEELGFWSIESDGFDGLIGDDNLFDEVGVQIEDREGKALDVRPIVKEIVTKWLSEDWFTSEYEDKIVEIIASAVNFEKKPQEKPVKMMLVTRRDPAKKEAPRRKTKRKYSASTKKELVKPKAKKKSNKKVSKKKSTPKLKKVTKKAVTKKATTNKKSANKKLSVKKNTKKKSTNKGKKVAKKITKRVAIKKATKKKVTLKKAKS